MPKRKATDPTLSTEHSKKILSTIRQEHDESTDVETKNFEEMERIRKWLDTMGYMIVEKLVVEGCKCKFPDLGLIPGYRGDPTLGCFNCSKRCPRCRGYSSRIDYAGCDGYYGTCYGCVIGENEKESSSESE